MKFNLEGLDVVRARSNERTNDGVSRDSTARASRRGDEDAMTTTTRRGRLED